MLRTLYRWIFRFCGIRELYQDVVQNDRRTDVKHGIRSDLQSLLKSVDDRNPFFRGKFTHFLAENQNATDEAFLKAYSRLPAFSKQDYAEAGISVMADRHSKGDPRTRALEFDGRPWDSLKRLRNGDFLMTMATGGSTSLPLIVYMTKHHMFSMLFTFFKCWYRMGWRPGDRMLVFYPRNTYNIDDMVKFNRYSRWTGFRYHLFDHVDLETVRGLVDDINRYKPRLLLVFPSPLNMIAHTIQKHQLPLKHHPELINVSGETFFDCQRKNIQQVFHRSKVEDSYGSVELGEIAHETDDGLEIFANVAYVETERNEDGQPEMIITRLHMTDFPFIRYRMKDIADVQFQTNDESGRERFVITRIEGKDTNFILSDTGERIYPSFFNQLVNDLNREFRDAIIEIKVYERDQSSLEVQLIVDEDCDQEQLALAAQERLHTTLSRQMDYRIRFVDFIDHDYRRKYRVIERLGDIEFAGGMVGDNSKAKTVAQLIGDSQSQVDDDSLRRNPSMTSDSHA